MRRTCVINDLIGKEEILIVELECFTLLSFLLPFKEEYKSMYWSIKIVKYLVNAGTENLTLTVFYSVLHLQGSLVLQLGCP